MKPNDILAFAHSNPDEFERIALKGLDDIRATRILERMPSGDASFLVGYLSGEDDGLVEKMLTAFGVNSVDDYFVGISRMEKVLEAVASIPSPASPVEPSPPPYEEEELEKQSEEYEEEEEEPPFQRWVQKGKDFSRDDGWRLLHSIESGEWDVLPPGVTLDEGEPVGTVDAPVDGMSWIDENY